MARSYDDPFQPCICEEQQTPDIRYMTFDAETGAEATKYLAELGADSCDDILDTVTARVFRVGAFDPSWSIDSVEGITSR